MNISAKLEVVITALRNREGFSGLPMKEVASHISLSDILALDVPKNEEAAFSAFSEVIKKAEATAKCIREHNRLQAEVAQIAHA